MRLFVSLVPPPEVVAGLPPLGPTVRPAPLGQAHLTLAFLGEVAAVEPVAAELAGVLADRPAPRLRLSGAGTFGSAVWRGVAGDLDVLARLAGDVQGAVRAAGVALEARRWRPHLTVGRGRLPHELSAHELSAYEGPVATWARVELVRSHLSAAGARHEPLHTWRLADPTAPQ